MPRPKKTIRTVSVHISLPEDLTAKVQLHLFSDVEGKVPFGKQAEFFTSLVKNYFDAQEHGL